jgi:hypothetical protein
MQRQPSNAVIVHRYADGTVRKVGGELVRGPDVPVPDEVQAERLAVCRACDKAKTVCSETVCSACSCGLDRRLERVVALSEAHGLKRCRHPKRGSGGGWLVTNAGAVL